MRLLRRGTTVLVAFLTAVGLSSAVAAPAQAITTTKATVSRNHSTVYVGHTITVSGSVTPSKTARQVILQRYSSGAWHSEWMTYTKYGKYTMTVPVSKVGTRTWRVYIPAGSGGTSFKSGSFTMKGVSHVVKSVTNKACKVNYAKRTIAYSFRVNLTDGHYRIIPATRPIVMTYTTSGTTGPLMDPFLPYLYNSATGERLIMNAEFPNCTRVG